MRLSPQTISGVLRIQRTDDQPNKNKIHTIETVTAYVCPKCGDLHEWRDDAVECCKTQLEMEADVASCPVCAEQYSTHRDAAECCLWKDLSAPERWKIADAVEAGSTWAEELGINYSARLTS